MHTPGEKAKSQFIDDLFYVEVQDAATDSEVQTLIATIRALPGVSHINVFKRWLFVTLNSDIKLEEVMTQAEALPSVKSVSHYAQKL